MRTYKRKTAEDLDCGVTVFMKVLGGKWKPCILLLIHQGYKRPSELHKRLPSATPRVVDMQLSELETVGMVTKEVQPGFPLRVDYSLTERGKGLLSIISLMDAWGEANAGWVKQINDQQLPADTHLPLPDSCKITIPNKFSVTE